MKDKRWCTFAFNTFLMKKYKNIFQRILNSRKRAKKVCLVLQNSIFLHHFKNNEVSQTNKYIWFLSSVGRAMDWKSMCPWFDSWRNHLKASDFSEAFLLFAQIIILSDWFYRGNKYCKITFTIEMEFSKINLLNGNTLVF